MCLFLADEPLGGGALDVVPGGVGPPHLHTVLHSSPRSPQGGGRPPVLIGPGAGVVPHPGPVSSGVGGPQPAVVVVPVSSQDGVDHQVLSLGGHAGEVAGVSLAGRLSRVIVRLSVSSLVAEPGVEGGGPASLAVTGSVGREAGMTGGGLLTDEVPGGVTGHVVPLPVRPHQHTVLLGVPVPVVGSVGPPVGVAPGRPLGPGVGALLQEVVGPDPGEVLDPGPEEGVDVRGVHRGQLRPLRADAGGAGGLEVHRVCEEFITPRPEMVPTRLAGGGGGG